MAYYLNETREAPRSRVRRMRDGASVRRSPFGQLEDDRAAPTRAVPGRPETRQTRRRVGPNGALARTAKSGGRSGDGHRPAGDAQESRHRNEDFAPQIAPYLRDEPARRRGRRVDIEALPHHESIAATRIDADGGPERMERVVGGL